MHKIGAVILALSVLISTPIYADKFAPFLSEETAAFGEYSIVSVLDYQVKTDWPGPAIHIKRGPKNVGLYRGMAFSKHFVSPDGRFFVGLSNYGLTDTTFVIFDDSVNLIRAKWFVEIADFCGQSVTLVREWYDEKNPQIDFVYRNPPMDKSLLDITVRGCNGESISLLSND